MNLKSTIAASAIGLMIASTAACGSDSETAQATGTTSDAQVEAAASFAKEYTDPVTEIDITTPLSKTPPTGKKLFWLQGNIASTEAMTPGMESAAEALGWTEKTIVFDPGNPSAANGAVEQALSQGADYIAISGIPVASYQSALDQAKQKGVPVFSSYSTETPDGEASGIYSNVGGLPQWQLFGKIHGNYIIADSKGKANVLFVSLSAYEVLAAQGPVLKQTLADGCPGCTYSEVDTTADDLNNGAIPGIVSNYLSGHPEIDYVVLASGFMETNLKSALEAAGQTDVTVLDTNPTLANLDNIKSGFEEAGVGLPTALSSWYMVDAMARLSVGDDLQPNWDSALPAQMFTKDLVPDPPVLYDGPSDYEEQFKQLWMVG